MSSNSTVLLKHGSLGARVLKQHLHHLVWILGFRVYLLRPEVAGCHLGEREGGRERERDKESMKMIQIERKRESD